MSLLVVGSVAYDTIQTPYGKADKVLGGSATYFSLSASYFTKVRLIACVGDDFLPKYVRLFNAHNIDVSGLEHIHGKTFHWTGKYEGDLSNPHTIRTHLNVFTQFDPILSTKARNCHYVFLANIDPHLQEKVLMQMKNPRLSACDSMNLWIENARKDLLKLLKKIDIFFVNETEIRQLTGQMNLVKAVKKVIQYGPQIVVVKKGEHGAVLFSDGFSIWAPAYLVETPKDPTGAGDSFAGGFMGYIAKCGNINQQTLRKALLYATTMASYTVENFSVRKLVSLTRKDVTVRMKELWDLSCWR